MILGVGVDLTEIARIQRALEDAKTGRRFRDRVYTAGEIEYCEGKGRGRYQSYAGRFAAKEAVMKALGRGWSSQVTWLEIEIVRDPAGKPLVKLHDKTSAFARARGIQELCLSITHAGGMAMAYVIAQGKRQD
ncbi:MAG: holo-ACP synthase [Deltaproteobacteria bacterium]|nr:holo-ACP synthase [Deltaproteobacteria bacterium]